MNKRRVFYTFLSILALFLLGTVVVLSSATYYLAIDPDAYLSEFELPEFDNSSRWNAEDHGQAERIPRIIHQTWKTDILPVRWQPISQACRDMMSDYEYMLWTDEKSREFIAQYYSWFLDTFDGYQYPIQRADVIRYFVLHYYGGVYLDLDIGCLRPMDPLLIFPVILPKTIPVGVSNDLIFAEKGHPFLQQAINNLVTFDHSWLLNYPTVMFSTGPMFLSAQYGIYTTSHPNSAGTEIRILPKSLYGKNAKPDEAPHSFFSHFYGSSWHADDAAFIGFLGSWGKVLMWVGLAVLILGVIRLPTKQRRNFRRMGGYDILLPRLSRSGRWHLQLGSSSLPPSPHIPSPISTESGSPTDGDDVSVLHLPFNVSPTSPNSDEPFAGRVQSPIIEAFRRVRNRVTSAASPREEVPMTPIRPRRQRYSRGVLFFLPAIFTQTSPDIELEASHSTPPSYASLNQVGSPSSQVTDEKNRLMEDLERGNDSTPSSRSHQRHETNLLDTSDSLRNSHLTSSSSPSSGSPS